MFSENLTRPSGRWLLLALIVALAVVVALSMTFVGDAEAKKKKHHKKHSTPMALTAPIVLMANLTGTAQVPPANPNGTGTATLSFSHSGKTDQVCANISVQNIMLPATAAHIHLGAAGMNGPVVVDLPTPTNGTSSGCVPISPTLSTAITQNPADYYVNVHNGQFPDGAVRGQLHT